MRTEQLRAILVIAETSSLREAAKRLEMSQSALSESIRRLEAEFGVELLLRSRGGTRLSAAGMAVLGRIDAVCRAADDLTATLHAYRSQPAVLRVAAVTSAINTVLPEALSELADDTTGQRLGEVELRIAGSDAVLDAVVRRQCDLGVIACEADNPPAVSGAEVTGLLAAPVGVAMPRGHRLGHAGVVDINALRDERMVVFGPGYLMQRVSRRVLAHIPTRTITQVESTPEAIRLVGAGVGLCVVPWFSVAAHEEVEWRPLAGCTEQISLVLVCARGMAPAPARERLINRILEHSRRFAADPTAQSGHNRACASTTVRLSV